MEARKINERYTLLKKREELSSEMKKIDGRMIAITKQNKEYQEQIYYRNDEQQQQRATNKLFQEFNELVLRKNELEDELLQVDNQLFK